MSGFRGSSRIGSDLRGYALERRVGSVLIELWDMDMQSPLLHGVRIIMGWCEDDCPCCEAGMGGSRLRTVPAGLGLSLTYDEVKLFLAAACDASACCIVQ